ncbi:MAG: AAA family ATPase [Microthrixaceae bacterium]
MLIRRLWLRDFRSYGELDLSFTDGTCVILGPNGVGKSNLLEAIGYAAQLDSFRSAPIDAMIRRGADSAVVRAQLDRNGREALVEAEINRSGRNRVLLNRQRLARTSDLTDVVLVTAFAPTDLELIKGVQAFVDLSSTVLSYRWIPATNRSRPASNAVCANATPS